MWHVLVYSFELSSPQSSQFDELYNARVRSRTFSPEDRVSLRRARPRMQKGTHRAIELRDIIKDMTDEWWPYIEILLSEVCQ